MSVPEQSVGAVYIVWCQTREPYFDHFEFECFETDGGIPTNLRVNVASAFGRYDEREQLWSQQDFVIFDGLTRGEMYAFRGRVVVRGGGASPWTAWALEVVGDTDGPNPTYATSAVFSQTGATISFTPTPDPPSADFDHYEVLWKRNSSSTPSATERPNISPVRDNRFFIPLAPSDEGYAWIRAVDTSGNAQAWTPLHPGTGWSILVSDASSVSMVQTRRTRGGATVALCTFQYTAPDDERFGGIELWMHNHDNLGKLERVGRFAVGTIDAVNSFLAVVDVDYAVGAAGSPFVNTVSHTVTFYLVAYTVDGVIKQPIEDSPSLAVTPGITGDYAGPLEVSNVQVYLGSAGPVVSWDNAFDPEVVGYNIYRQVGGTHSDPEAADFSQASRVDARVEDVVAAGLITPRLRYVDAGFSVPEKDPADPTRVCYWVTGVTGFGQESDEGDGTGMVELVTAGAGDNQPEPKDASFNKLYNARWNARAVSSSALSFDDGGLAIIAGTAGPDPVVQLDANFPGEIGDFVIIAGSTGPAPTDPYVDGCWEVTDIPNPDEIVLRANPPLAWGAGGDVWWDQGQGPGLTDNARVVIGSGTFFSATDDSTKGEGFWGYSGSPRPKWHSDGTGGTGEVTLEDPGAGGANGVAIRCKSSRFARAEPIVISVYAKEISAGTGKLRMDLNQVSAVSDVEFDRDFLTGSYRRFAWNVRTDDFPAAAFPVTIQYRNYNVAGGGGAGDIRLMCPMVNSGDNPALWSGVQGGEESTPRMPVRPTPPPWEREVATCLREGSLVLLSTGDWTPIERVKRGAYVMCFADGKLEATRVERIVRGRVRQMYVVRSKEGSALECTGVHRFMLESGGFQNALHLYGGDRLASVSGSGKPGIANVASVGSVTSEDRDFRVFNLHVEHPAHNYVAESFVVHNVKILRDPNAPYND